MTQPLRYAINVTLDGCCSHEAGLPPDAESMAFWTDELRRSNTLLCGRVTYELMEGAWRRPESGVWPDWMDASEDGVDLKLELVERRELRSGASVQRYRPA